MAIVGSMVMTLQVARSETLRKAETLEQLLKAADIAELVRETRERGDPRRGALLFYRSPAACVLCHASGEGQSPLGPNLAQLQSGAESSTLTDEYLIQSLLYPSKDIRKGFETVKVLTEDGTTVTGIIVEDHPERLILRSASDIEHPIAIDIDTIEARTLAQQSMMPDGLISALRDQVQFFDLAAYVIEVARGGQKRAAELKPSAEQLAIKEDWLNLDHAGILKSLKTRDFEAGQAIYHGFCVDCHGSDGNRPSLPTARAFGTQPMKFGADPHRMFMTLTKGNGLMGPMSHLTPHERYQVVHYIRERFMKPANPEYQPVDQGYLAGLPKGTEDGKAIVSVERDFGPVLGSQLERRVRSALTIKLDEDISLCYDLHTMNQAEVWRGGFLDLDNTQHQRSRGEGTANPKGKPIAGLQGWQWGHEGTLDYSREGLLPRGPMPARWMDYHGYYLHGQQVVLSYGIDGREVLEAVQADSASNTIRHHLELGPGPALVLAVIEGLESEHLQSGVVPLGASQPQGQHGDAVRLLAMNGILSDGRLGAYSGAAVIGETQGLTWTIDDQRRIVLAIPASPDQRRFEIVCRSGQGRQALVAFGQEIDKERSRYQPARLSEQTKGGGRLWPETIKTVGARGLQRGAYALDTITIPESTPWQTWFRTSALDFLSDGRMVVTTYGGDVWMVSGIDDRLMSLEWKRFAAGLYEPFGVKVVDDRIYVTCKDRIVRLHDQDQNGEADFYESFSPDTDVSFFFHAFNFDLQTDSQGNFYYAKGGHDSDFALPGAVIKVSPDGSKQSVYCTGFRVPNGLGSMPGDRITSSDNQGQWMPASKVNLLREGGFYGWVPTYDGKGKWAPDGGKIDIKKVVPPTTFDEPLVWMPQEFDNSSGGQLWNDDRRWGPLAGRLMHLSFGKGWMSYLMIQEVEGVSQAAIIRLPFDFRTGIMRGRVNPKDGQVYACGLQGWNGEGRIGLLDQGIQRLRYTGKPLQMITDCKVESDGLRIDFNFAIDPASASDLASYTAKHWNYRWQAEYGSEMYSPTTGKIGAEAMRIDSVTIADDRRSLKLHVSNLQPVDQVQLILKMDAADGSRFEEEVYWTIHRIPHGREYFKLRGGLKNSQAKFTRDKAGRVAFVGGSITAAKGWRDLVGDDLRRRFPDTQFEFIAAGISSLGSTPGAFRLDRDVLSKGPIDLLFEEAAVNDDTNGFSDVEQIRGMEGIVRQARLANPAIDIVLLHFVDPGKMAMINEGKTPAVIANHEQVAERYRLPSIDLAKEVTERIRAGEFEWEKDFRDLHPSPFGHQLYARSIGRLFSAAWSETAGSTNSVEAHPLPEPIDAYSYFHGRLLRPDEAVARRLVTLDDHWKLDPSWQPVDKVGTREGFVKVPTLVSETVGGTLQLRFEGRGIGIFVAAGPDTGNVEYRVDGGEWQRQELFTQWSPRLHLPWAKMLASELSFGEHVLELRVASQVDPRSRGHAIRITHFLVNGR